MEWKAMRGEEVGSSKLTEKDVREIRRLHSEGNITHRELAKMFGMSKTATSMVINLKQWQHVSI